MSDAGDGPMTSAQLRDSLAGRDPAGERLEGLPDLHARPALDDVSVEVERGEFAFLIGPSGSGKSTFLRLLLREDVPTPARSGSPNCERGAAAGRRVPRLRQRIGCVFQDFRLLPNKTVDENVAFALEVIGKPRHTIRTVVPEVLELVDLAGKADRMPSSSPVASTAGRDRPGVRQPAAGPARRRAHRQPRPRDRPPGIMTLLERINRTGTTVLMATHDRQIVDSMRRRVVELSAGKLARDDARGVYGVAR